MVNIKETLINNFLRISKIPRESGHEEKIANFFVSIAKENNLWYLKDDTEKIINEILELQCGFITDNMDSANLGLIETKENEIKIYYTFRSMDYNELEIINNKTKLLKNDFIVNEKYRDPIWEVNYESMLLKRYKEIYFKEYNNYPKEEICHGSIECSSLKEGIEGLDIICIGSIIEKYHTTEEATYISSWIKIYNLLTNFITYKQKSLRT